MKIINFPHRNRMTPGQWQPSEWQEIVAACSGSVASGEASGWEVGVTECGDPQLYLIGPAPNYDCVLCISRVGLRTVIEDGKGNVLHEHDGTLLLAGQALAALRRRKMILLGHMAVVWQALRDAFEEKTDMLTEDSIEVLAHIAPQLSVLV